MSADADLQNRAPSLDRALLDTSHPPLLLFDRDLRAVFATRSFRAAFDMRDDEIVGRLLGELGRGEWNIPEVRLLLENAVLGGGYMGNFETDLAQVGAMPRRLVVNVQTVIYDDPDSPRILLTINDVTDLRRVDRLNVALLLEKDGLLRERATLLEEMQHRVANSLQIIASVLLLKARAVASDETRAALNDAHDRVMSVAAVQQHLRTSLGVVEVAPYLEKLCESLGSSMIRDSRPLTLAVRADAATMSSQEAVSLGLIVTELVINALKHAFPEGRGGEIVVGYEVAEAGWVLSVTDNGVGRPATDPKPRGGLGTSVVEALARQLGAHVVLSDAGPGARVVVERVAAPELAAAE